MTTDNADYTDPGIVEIVLEGVRLLGGGRSSASEQIADDKLRAIEALWADLSKNDRFESPAWHAQALREAERAIKSGKAKFGDWEIAKKRIRRKEPKRA